MHEMHAKRCMVPSKTLSIKCLCRNRFSEIVRECTPTRALCKKQSMLPEMGDKFLKSFQDFELEILKSI